MNLRSIRCSPYVHVGSPGSMWWFPLSAHSNKVLGLIWPSLSVWGFHVLPESEWVPSGLPVLSPRDPVHPDPHHSVSMFSRFSPLCCVPASETMTPQRPSLFPAAHPLVLSRRSSAGGVSAGAWIIRVRRSLGHASLGTNLDVLPTVRGREPGL